MEVISFIFGLCAMASLFLMYQQKRRGRLILCKLSADIFWVGHYLFLGAFGGMVPNFVGIFREIVFSRRGKSRWADSRLVPIAFVVLNWAIGAFTFKSPINILPIAASAFVTISLWLRDPRLTKLISIPVSLTFLIYDIIVGSFIGAVNESMAIISIIISFWRTKKMNKSIFTPDHVTELPEIVIERASITEHRAVIETIDAGEDVLWRGREFSREITNRFVGDFEKKETDKMVHVSTFRLIDGTIYMSYYANISESAEDPKNQTARFCFCPESNTAEMTFFDIMAVGDEICGERIELVYDTIFAEADSNTLFILWTAKAGDRYYRFYRTFDIKKRKLGEVRVNRFKVGGVTNDFSTSGIISALSENGIGHKQMYSDIGIMQKFTSRTENGVKYYYTGAYSGDHNMIIKSSDFVTWEYVSAPDFLNASKWENATYVKGDRCYYFVRQHDEEKYGFLTVYDLVSGKWESPVLIEDCQSRSDFIEYNGVLYLIHAPVDREHIGIIRIDEENIGNSRAVLIADMKGSCFYPYVDNYRDGEQAMSYTVDRKHIRLARFDLGKYA